MKPTPASLIVALLGMSIGVSTQAADQSPPAAMHEAIESTCIDCHDDFESKAELNLTRLPWTLKDMQVRERWIKVYDRIAAGEMPPDEDDLPNDLRTRVLKELRDAITQVELDEIRQSGRGPLRRLTRDEYEANLRDLLHLPHLDVADRVPEDRSSHGFTKVSGLLDMSRVQLQGYLDAAEAAIREAVASGVSPRPAREYRAVGIDLFPSNTTFGGREAMFFARNGKMLPGIAKGQEHHPDIEMALFRSATWPYFGYPRGFVARLAGEYEVRFSARAVRQLPGYRLVPAYDPQPMSFRARRPSGPDVSGDVRETGGWIDLQPEPKVFKTTIRLKPRETFEYSLLGLPVPFIRTDGGFFYDYPPMPPDGHRGAAFQWLEVKGPITTGDWPPASHKALFADLPIREPSKPSAFKAEVITKNPDEDAKQLFKRFVRRAAHRPISDDALSPYLTLVRNKLDEGSSFVEAMAQGYQAFLCSGHFLYLTEPRDDHFAMASRLSHLFWNAKPDDQLTSKATDRSIFAEKTLRDETDRLIDDPRFDRFVADFTNQWLDLRQLRRDIPDVRLYPEYRRDDYLVDSMEHETHAFVAAMVRENLPVTTLIDSDFTFVNDRLAAHYGLPRQQGSFMRRVDLPAWSPYGGLLTQASMLKLTANGTTTSPVVRGVWVMEKLIGQQPPKPPKEVPAIEPDIRGAKTIRDLLAKHTKSKSCASCHARFDPVGFALENFDVMGAWRDRYRGLSSGDKITGIDRAGHPFEYRIGPEVDASGRLLSGEKFADVFELKQLLLAKPRQLARNMLHQLTLYATGTPVRFADRPEIEQILDDCRENGYRIRDLIHQLVASRLFRGLAPLKN